MGKPAARVGDMHVCPKVTPGTEVPHVGGLIIGPGCGTVLIEGKPAATVGDECGCVGEMDKITGGSSGVFIEGNLAARSGDMCEHGGSVTGGSKTVLIGGSMKWVKANVIKKLSAQKKSKAINQIIQLCVILLEKKQKLLMQEDQETLAACTKWFGQTNQESKLIILNRITRMLEVSKGLSVENFEQKLCEEAGSITFASIYPDDSSYRILIWNDFWKASLYGKNSRSGTLIHELSHSNNIGNTFDYVRGEKDCLRLAEVDPGDALYNADSFEYFIEE